MEMADMGNKTVMITGASRGIGRAAALCFARNGFQLALSCRTNTGLLDGLAEEIRSRYPVNCLNYTGDMGDWRQAAEFCERAERELGPADILVNNAGISYIGLLTDMGPDDWRNIISANLDSVFNCCRRVIPSMVSRKSGHIINISSVWGCCGASCEAAYSASKGGVNALTQALAKELAPSGIAVNAIAFGVIDTDMNRSFSEDERAALAEEIPACRFAAPEEAAEEIFRLSQASPYLTGQIIRFDGGWI